LSTGNEEGINVAEQRDDPDSLWSYYRNLILIRGGYAALQSGDFAMVESDARAVYSFLRHTQDQTLLVLINLSDESLEEYTLTLETGPLSNISAVDVIFGDGEPSLPIVNANGGIDAYVPLPSLPAYSTTIIRLS
jgi:glycosidase